MTDTRVAFGARCTWWDDIHQVGRHPFNRLPCCPHCKGMLFEKSDLASFMADVDAYEADGHPGYRALLTWMRGRCYRTLEAASAAYLRSLL